MKRSKQSRKMNREIGKETVRQANQGRLMDTGVIRRINSGVAAMADGQKMREKTELRNWQWEIVLRNESTEED